MYNMTYECADVCGWKRMYVCEDNWLVQPLTV